MSSPKSYPWENLGRPRLGVSSCLLGQAVRYDGGHKRDRYLVDTLGEHVEWVPICPEVEVGMGTPRPPIRLQRRDDEIALIDPESETDWTARMKRFAGKRTRGLDREGLSGYVLKRASPSCGMERVAVYTGLRKAKRGTGLYADALMERFPLLPVEEEGRLNDAGLRESFVERIFAYQRLQGLFGTRWTVGKLVAFQTAHKLQLMAHSPAHYRETGRIVAAAKGRDRDALKRCYSEAFMAGMGRHPTRGRQTNALQHMAGYVSKALDTGDRAELTEAIEDYRQGRAPFFGPLTLIRHHVRRQNVEYLSGQTYLNPHPSEVLLRSHA